MTPPSTSPAPRWPWLLSSAALLADQFSKNWFLDNFALEESRVVLPGFFHFTLTHNTGAAFSLFRGHPGPLLLFSLLVFGLMVAYRDRLFSRHPLEQTAFGFLCGGILGNLVDRTKYGYVIDFIHWFVGEYHWPVFNLADSFICVGVALYLLSSLRHKPQPAPASSPKTSRQ